MSVGPLALLGAAATTYLIAVRRARRWPTARTVPFLGGLIVLAAALASPLHTRAEEQLSLHMVQHLMIVGLAAPLIVLGAPLTLAVRVLRGPARDRAVAVARILRPLGHPAVGLALFTITVLATHLPPLYSGAVDHPALHELEHGLYLTGGMAFWWPLLGAEPLPRRLGAAGRLTYLLLAMPAMGAIGALMMAAPDALYEAYPSIGEQRLAGALMWVAGSAPLLVAAVLETWRALAREEQRVAIREAVADRRAGVSRR